MLFSILTSRTLSPTQKIVEILFELGYLIEDAFSWMILGLATATVPDHTS